MGTHPIFESDFDCLTECLLVKAFYVCQMLQKMLQEHPQHSVWISRHCKSRISNHVSIFSECLSGHIESVFLDKTNSFLSVDTTMSVTLAGGILSFMCEPNVFVAHISSLLDNRNRTQKWDESPC